MFARSLGLVFVGLCLVSLSGCGEARPVMAPAKGKVLFKGQPLKFGGVRFQPMRGEAARGEIQSDGTFVLTTFTEGDGALVGPHLVLITSFEGQAPTATGSSDSERALGKSLIPEKFNDFESSGLKAEVKAQDNNEFVFELK